MEETPGKDEPLYATVKVGSRIQKCQTRPSE